MPRNTRDITKTARTSITWPVEDKAWGIFRKLQKKNNLLKPEASRESEENIRKLAALEMCLWLKEAYKKVDLTPTEKQACQEALDYIFIKEYGFEDKNTHEVPSTYEAMSPANHTLDETIKVLWQQLPPPTTEKSPAYKSLMAAAQNNIQKNELLKAINNTIAAVNQNKTNSREPWKLFRAPHEGVLSKPQDKMLIDRLSMISQKAISDSRLSAVDIAKLCASAVNAAIKAAPGAEARKGQQSSEVMQELVKQTFAPERLKTGTSMDELSARMLTYTEGIILGQEEQPQLSNPRHHI